jgi:hypothetical protein
MSPEPQAPRTPFRCVYHPGWNAYVTLDERGRVRHILHTQAYWPCDRLNPRDAACEYVKEFANAWQIQPRQLANLAQKPSYLEPREQGVEYRLQQVKKSSSSAVYCFAQTVHNIPVWHCGVSVSVKFNPYRIVHGDYVGYSDLQVKLPSRKIIEHVRDALLRVDCARAVEGVLRNAQGFRTPMKLVRPSYAHLFAALRRKSSVKARVSRETGWMSRMTITRGRFFIYRYDASSRQEQTIGLYGKPIVGDEARSGSLTLPLPPVPRHIEDGRDYLVAEIVFHLKGSRGGRRNWKALVEIQTGAILWLRSLTAGITGLVFVQDPKTSTGDLTNTPELGNTQLNAFRSSVDLLDLDPPEGGTQHLSGTHVRVVEADPPAVTPPTKSAGKNFDGFNARTDDFAAVNAYYHTNSVFRTIEDLGIDLDEYFDGTATPVTVDHRASFTTTDGIEINAFCDGDSEGDGIGVVGFCLSDMTHPDFGNQPLGRAVDNWVTWHELGGHGILLDHIEALNLPFAHSAGDALAAFQNDPDSKLRNTPTRFQYAPFRKWDSGQERFFDRKTSDGWKWHGSHDIGGYFSEQILATTLFRMYRSLGGDAERLETRKLASRVATYLVLHGVGHLSPTPAPENAEDFFNALVAADADDWTAQGFAGGAYHKVIRWSFEKQDLFQGSPPDVDLYIDDGRGGEYEYQPDHWNNKSVWNRLTADGVAAAQPAHEGQPNFAYVKVKNRGTRTASGTVKLYHCRPGAGLTWPIDFEQATPLDGLPTGSLAAGSAAEVIVGPFTWTPHVNALGHDCLLAIVSGEADVSNVETLEATQTIQEWRLVPHDNNVGQRNIVVLAGAGGAEALARALTGAPFFARNNLNLPAVMELQVRVPPFLAERGWGLGFADLEGDSFRLKAGAKRTLKLEVVRGKDFTAAEFRRQRERRFIVTLLANGIQLGGMTYEVNPDLR